MFIVNKTQNSSLMKMRESWLPSWPNGSMVAMLCDPLQSKFQTAWCNLYVDLHNANLINASRHCLLDGLAARRLTIDACQLDAAIPLNSCKILHQNKSFPVDLFVGQEHRASCVLSKHCFGCIVAAQIVPEFSADQTAARASSRGEHVFGKMFAPFWPA